MLIFFRVNLKLFRNLAFSGLMMQKQKPWFLEGPLRHKNWKYFLYNDARLPKEHYFMKVPRLRQCVLLVRATCRYRWARSFSGNILTGQTEVLGENGAPVPLCPLQVSNGLTWDKTRSSAATGRRITAWEWQGLLLQLRNVLKVFPVGSQLTTPQGVHHER